MSKRFTIEISDQLNTWLEEQAQLNHRSKNKQIEHFLELARDLSMINISANSDPLDENWFLEWAKQESLRGQP